MKLYLHQRRIIADDPKKCGLFLGVGSGKTRIALELAKGSILVICPKTQREDGNWEREYKMVLQDQLMKYKPGEMPKTLKPQLTVMSKEEFRRDHVHLQAFHTIIVDEAHTCLGVTPSTRQRNRMMVPRCSQLFEALEHYLARTKPERIYLCTGTIVRSPMTVWGAAKILGKKKDFYDWRDMYYQRLPIPGREIWVLRKGDKIKKILAQEVRELGYIGRLDDFFDVPEQTYKTQYIELTAKQQARLKSIPIEFPDKIVQVGKRHQVENGILTGDQFNEGEVFPNGKIDAILEIALQYPKFIVFAKYRVQIEQIALTLANEGYRVFTMTGDTKDRGQLLADANRSEECVFVVQAQISAGWELPDFPCMVFASMSYSFVDRVQAEGRIQRVNNIKKNLYIDLIVRKGVDEAVQDCIKNKKDFDEHIYLNKI